MSHTHPDWDDLDIVNHCTDQETVDAANARLPEWKSHGHDALYGGGDWIFALMAACICLVMIVVATQ